MWGQRLSFWLTTAVTPSERIVMPYSASAIDIVRCWWVMMMSWACSRSSLNALIRRVRFTSSSADYTTTIT